MVYLIIFFSYWSWGQERPKSPPVALPAISFESIQKKCNELSIEKLKVALPPEAQKGLDSNDISNLDLATQYLIGVSHSTCTANEVKAVFSGYRWNQFCPSEKELNKASCFRQWVGNRTIVDATEVTLLSVITVGISVEAVKNNKHKGVALAQLLDNLIAILESYKPKKGFLYTVKPKDKTQTEQLKILKAKDNQANNSIKTKLFVKIDKKFDELKRVYGQKTTGINAEGLSDKWVKSMVPYIEKRIQLLKKNRYN